MSSDRKFTVAGVARRGTVLHFRASNRADYPKILEKEGDTDVMFVTLPEGMSKDAAKLHLLTLKKFRTPEIKAVLANQGQVIPSEKTSAPKLIAPKAASKPKSGLVKGKPKTVEMEQPTVTEHSGAAMGDNEAPIEVTDAA